MGCCSQPDAPAAPNPQDLINQQGNQTFYNQNGPFGSSNWSQGANGQWTQNVSLNPDVGNQLQQQQQAGGAAAMQGNQNLQATLDRGIYDQPMDFSKLPGYQSSFGDVGDPRAALQGNNLQSSFGWSPENSAALYNGVQSVSDVDRYDAKGVRAGTAGVARADYSGGPDLNRDYGAQREEVIGALRERYNRELGERYGDQERELQNRLANQGLTVGSENYREQTGDFNTSRDVAYRDALTQAILAGGQEQSRLYGMDLSARQQLSGEQQYNAGLEQSANIANAGFATQAGIASAQDRQFGANQDLARQGQAFGQAYMRGNQGYDQAMGGGQFANSARQGNLNNYLAAQGQAYGQGMGRAQLNNSTVNPALQQALLQRGQPLTEAQSLLGFGNMQLPNFNTPQAPDVVGPYSLQQAALQSQYGAGNQNYQGMLGGITGLVGTGLQAWLGS